jgi:hypothetical protein
MHLSLAVELHFPLVQYGVLASKSAQGTLPAWWKDPDASKMQIGAVVQL